MYIIIIHVHVAYDLHTNNYSEYELSNVMREVRALAKLENHPNVVRYNTSWKEIAPPDWKTRKHWSKLKESDIMYVSQYTCVYIHVYNYMLVFFMFMHLCVSLCSNQHL